MKKLCDEFEKVLVEVEINLTIAEIDSLRKSLHSVVGNNTSFHAKKIYFDEVLDFYEKEKTRYEKLKASFEELETQELINIILEFLEGIKEITDIIRLGIIYEDREVWDRDIERKTMESFRKVLKVFGVRIKYKCYKIEAITGMRFSKKIEHYE